MMPIRPPRTSRMARSSSVMRSRPSSRIRLPGSMRSGGSSRRSSERAVRLLPLPDSPTRQRVRPGGMAKETPSTTGRPATVARSCSTCSRVCAIGAWVGTGRSAAALTALMRREVEFDFRSVGIEEEQLPYAGPDLLAEVVLNPVLLQLLFRARQVGGGERHVVEHAGALVGQLAPADHVQHRLLADVEPDAGKGQRRAVAFGQAEDVGVEPARRLEVLGDDGEMVHPLDLHPTLLS